jgi:hypothetical protein
MPQSNWRGSGKLERGAEEMKQEDYQDILKQKKLCHRCLLH